MSDQYIGEIRIFGGNFPPKGWAYCDGSLLPIRQNTALFSILGTSYGGDGRTTFALPNLSSAAPMNQGRGAGLSARTIGEAVGTGSVTLTVSQIPAHNHLAQSQTVADSPDPEGAVWSDISVNPRLPKIYSSTANAVMNVQAVGNAGNNQPHNNMQPYLGLSFIIALEGVFPSRP